MLNAKHVLIVAVVALFIAGISMEANASEYSEQQVTRDTVCATLATNAEYPYKAQYYITQIKPYFAEHIEYIKRVVKQVHHNVYEQVEQNGSSILIESQSAFNNYCNRPFI